uniref:Non-specific serine/threonine protein kinase n=1 Tax=Rhabditophanes sp. KR3021 TaxID=114890 RepID=A0AC35U2U7_9BILA
MTPKLHKKWTFKLKSSILPRPLRDSKFIQAISSSKVNRHNTSDNILPDATHSDEGVLMSQSVSDDLSLEVIQNSTAKKSPLSPSQLLEQAKREKWSAIEEDSETTSLAGLKQFAREFKLKKVVHFVHFRKDYLFNNNSSAMDIPPTIGSKDSFSHVKVDNQTLPLIDDFVNLVHNAVHRESSEEDLIPLLHSLESISTVKIADSKTLFCGDFFQYINELEAEANADSSLKPLLASLAAISRVYIDTLQTMVYGEFFAGIAEMEDIQAQTTVLIPLLSTLDTVNVAGSETSQVCLFPLLESMDQLSKVSVQPFEKNYLKNQEKSGSSTSVDIFSDEFPPVAHDRNSNESIGSCVNPFCMNGSLTKTPSGHVNDICSQEDKKYDDNQGVVCNVKSIESVTGYLGDFISYTNGISYKPSIEVGKEVQGTSSSLNNILFWMSDSFSTIGTPSSTFSCVSCSDQVNKNPSYDSNSSSLLYSKFSNSSMNKNCNPLPPNNFYLAEAGTVLSYLKKINTEIESLNTLQKSLQSYIEFLDRQSDI